MSSAAAQINVDAVCDKAKRLPLPSQDKPGEAQRKQLASCDAEDLYYGITRAPDLAAARLCAYAQLEPDQGIVFGGAGILMMIYANGEGVPRNLDLARRFVCQFEGAPAELAGRLAYLDDVQAKRVAPKKKWDICDDITSGFMGGHCSAHAQRFEERDRTRALAQLTEPWSEPQRAAFEKLRTAATGFIDLHAESEIDLSGTLRGAMVIEEAARMKDGFIAELRALASGKFPSFSAEDFRRADAALNATYGKLMKADLSLSTVTTDGVRATQRAWIKYRDAWVQFGAVKYPQVTADAWRTSLTRAREAQLREVYDTFAAK